MADMSGQDPSEIIMATVDEERKGATFSGLTATRKSPIKRKLSRTQIESIFSAGTRAAPVTYFVCDHNLTALQIFLGDSGFNKSLTCLTAKH